MRAMVARAMDRIVAHVASLPTQPMHAVSGRRRLARALREPVLPEEGRPFEELLELLFRRVIPRSLNTASGGYLAYIPGGGLFHSAVADLVADATNRYVGVFQAAPGLVQIEENVIGWFARMMGLPPTAGGLLTTGGSLANLIAVVAARRERLPPDFLRGVVYTSEEAHHSVRKAALVAGLLEENIRAIPTDARFRMIPEAVADEVRRDRAAGRLPFLLVASAGTTGTGAVDPLGALADVAAEHGLFLHVDAAYGGFFALTERGRATMAGIERADAVTLDPHKGLFLPYGTGGLVVRDREVLRRTYKIEAAYMPAPETELDLVDYSDLGPELSRDARGLRVWLPLAMHGAGVFRAQLDEKLDLARRAADRIRAMPNMEIVAEPELSLLAFRARPPGVLEGPELDAWNRRLLGRVNARQRVFLTGTMAKGKFVIRMCILSFRTHADRVDAGLEDLEAGMAELGSGSP